MELFAKLNAALVILPDQTLQQRSGALTVVLAEDLAR